MIEQEKILKDKLEYYIEKIKSEEIKGFVEKCLEKAPEKFWIEKSSLRFHQPDERGEFGLLIHTLRVCRMVDVFSEVIGFDYKYKDSLLAAAILHDLCKYGVEGESKKILTAHPELFKEFLDKNEIEWKNSNTLKYIVELVRLHMGIFGSSDLSFKRPQFIAVDVLIFSDFIATRDDVAVDA
jgi:hypothetical protein